MDEDVLGPFSAPGVLANDYDEDEEPLTAELVVGPSSGSLVFYANGAFTFTPEANFHGTVQFAYRAFDGEYYSDLAWVTLVISPVNDEPTAVNDAFEGEEDAPVTGNVLGNDFDVDGDPLEVSLVSGPQHGSVDLQANGDFTFTPNGDWHGVDSFTYQVSDGVLTSQATVQLTVSAVNDAPVAVNDSYQTDEDTPVSGNVLANDWEPDGDELSAELVSGPSHAATFEFNVDGSFTYIPESEFEGEDVFWYAASAAHGAAAEVTPVYIRVTGVPIGFADTYALSDEMIAEETPLVVSAADGLLANDFPGLVSGAVVELIDGPSYGTLTLTADPVTEELTGGFEYTPGEGFEEEDAFTYRVFIPGAGWSAAVTARVVAAAAPAASIMMRSITYAGGTEVRRDPVGNLGGQRRAAGVAHWTDANGDGKASSTSHASDVAWPYLFTRGDKMTIRATLQLNRAGYEKLRPLLNTGSDKTLLMQGIQKESVRGGSVQLKATGPGGFEFVFTPEKANNQKESWSLERTFGQHDFPGAVFQLKTETVQSVTAFELAKWYSPSEPFVLTWQVSLDKGQTWQSFDSLKPTQHVFYVGLAKSGFPEGLEAVHSIVHLGAMKLGELTAQQQATPLSAAVVDKIWEGFKDRDVMRWQGYYFANQAAKSRLQYYGRWDINMNDPFETAEDLLRQSDGQCDAWANLFRDVLIAMGLPAGKVSIVQVRPTLEGANGFLIKDWQGMTNQTAFVHRNDFKLMARPTPMEGPTVYSRTQNKWSYDFVRAAVIDQVGIGGQNTGDPRSAFRIHVLVHIPDLKRYFDPSYGGTPLAYDANPNTAWEAWEQRSVAAWFQAERDPTRPMTISYQAWLVRANPNGVDVVFGPPQ